MVRSFRPRDIPPKGARLWLLENGHTVAAATFRKQWNERALLDFLSRHSLPSWEHLKMLKKWCRFIVGQTLSGFLLQRVFKYKPVGSTHARDSSYGTIIWEVHLVQVSVRYLWKSSINIKLLNFSVQSSFLEIQTGGEVAIFARFLANRWLVFSLDMSFSLPYDKS